MPTVDSGYKINRISSAGGFEAEHKFYEQVKGLKFTYLNDGNVHYQEHFKYNDPNVINLINQVTPISKVPWPLVEKITPYENFDEEIWWPIQRFIYAHVDLMDEELYPVLTAWVIASYTLEKWQTVPYIFAFGSMNSGKTRLLEVLAFLVYRGVITPDISEAALYRFVEKYKPTLFVDETEILNQDSHVVLVGLLNAGYRRGQYAIRARKEAKDGEDVELFNVFGFKGLAGTSELKDTLQSRSIMAEMQKATREINLFIDQKEAEGLREKLLYHRLKTLNDLNDPNDPNDPFIELKIPEEFKVIEGRVAELFFSLYYSCGEHVDEIINYASKVVKSRDEDEEVSVEALILTKLSEIEDTVINNKFLTKDLADKFNEDRADRDKWKASTIGRVLSRLHFTKTRLTNGQHGFYWNESFVQRLFDRYKVTSLPSLPSKRSLTSFCIRCGRALNVDAEGVASRPVETKEGVFKTEYWHILCPTVLEEER